MHERKWLAEQFEANRAICERLLTECWARELRLTTPFRKPGSGSADPEHRRCLRILSVWRCWSCSKRLAPAERVAFVLHDMFDLAFEEIAPIINRSPVAARQLASRARRRVQEGPLNRDDDVARQRGGCRRFPGCVPRRQL